MPTARPFPCGATGARDRFRHPALTVASRGPTEALRRFVDQYAMNLDHVAVLLALRDHEGSAQSPTSLALLSRLDRGVVDRALGDLAAWRLLRRDGSQLAFDPPAAQRPLVDELIELYRTKPVTLIRMIYARPPR